MSDRIAVMSRGRVEQIGTPEEIYDKPASIFVAGFIGSANLLPGRRRARRPPPRRRRSTWRWAPRSTSTSVADIAPGGDVTVMLRPERMTPDDGEPLPGRSVVGDDQGGHLPGLGDAADRRPRRRHGDHRRDRSRRGHRADQGRQPGHAGLDARGSLRAPGAHGDRRRHEHRLRRGRGDDGGRARRRRRRADGPATPGRRAAATVEKEPFNRRKFLIGGGVVAAGVARRRRCSRASGAAAAAAAAARASAAGDGGGGLGDGADELEHHQLDRVHRRDRGRRGGHDRPLPGRDRDRRSTTRRPGTTTTRPTARSSSPTWRPATPPRGTSPCRPTGWPPASRPRTGWRRSRTTSSRTT